MEQGVAVSEMALEERKFLHDISNHMSIAQGMVNIVLKRMKEADSMDPSLIEKQEKALKALLEQAQLMKKRRALLHARS